MKYTELVSFKITKKLRDRLEVRAKELKMTVSEWLRYIISMRLYE